MISARKGRPLGLRLTGGQRHDSAQARACAQTWTAAPLTAMPSGPAGTTGFQAALPARPSPGSPTYDPEAYQARYAVARVFAWFKGRRRMATRYAPYAHRCLGFLYLAGLWIWLKLKFT